MFVVPYVVLKLQVEMAVQNDVDAHCYELMMWGLRFLFVSLISC
jgi:hypothetical protein